MTRPRIQLAGEGTDSPLPVAKPSKGTEVIVVAGEASLSFVFILEVAKLLRPRLSSSTYFDVLVSVSSLKLGGATAFIRRLDESDAGMDGSKISSRSVNVVMHLSLFRLDTPPPFPPLLVSTTRGNGLGHPGLE